MCGQRGTVSEYGGLSGGWYIGPYFAATMALASVLFGGLAVWVALAVFRRGLHVSMPLVAPMRRDRPVSTSRARQLMVYGDPYLMLIRLTARGLNSIRSADFDGGKDLVIDVGVPIVELLGCWAEPDEAPRPQAWCAGTTLHVQPILIRPKTKIYFELLTADGRPARLTCREAPVADVRLRKAAGDDRPPKPWPMALGVVTACLVLGVPYVLPRFAATQAYKVASVALGVIVLGVIAIATIKIVTRMHRRGM